MVKPFSEGLQRLQQRLNQWRNCFSDLETLYQRFATFSTECVRKVKMCQNRTNIDTTALQYFLKTWFGHFIGIKDEINVLIKGELMRLYHKTQHKDWIHDRGRESVYFVDKYELSSCSLDGLDYQYRSLSKLKPDSRTLDNIAMQLDVISNDINEMNNQVDKCLYDVKKSCVDINLSSVEVSCLHNHEYVKVSYMEDLLCIERVQFDLNSSRDLIFTFQFDDIDINLKMSTSSSRLKSSRTLIIDSDDEIEGNSLQFEMNTSVKDIKRAHGVDEDEWDKYDSDGNIIDRDLKITTKRQKVQENPDNMKNKVPIVATTAESATLLAHKTVINESLVKLEKLSFPLKIIDPTSDKMVISLSTNLFMNKSVAFSASSKCVIKVSTILLYTFQTIAKDYQRLLIPTDVMYKDRLFTNEDEIEWDEKEMVVVRCFDTAPVISFLETLHAKFDNTDDEVILYDGISYTVLRTLCAAVNQGGGQSKSHRILIDFSNFDNAFLSPSAAKQISLFFETFLSSVKELDLKFVILIRQTKLPSTLLSLCFQSSSIIDFSGSMDLNSISMLSSCLQHFVTEGLIFSHLMLFTQPAAFHICDAYLAHVKIEEIRTIHTNEQDEDNRLKIESFNKLLQELPWVKTIVSVISEIGSLHQLDLSYPKFNYKPTLLLHSILHGLYQRRRRVNKQTLQQIILHGYPTNDTDEQQMTTFLADIRMEFKETEVLL